MLVACEYLPAYAGICRHMQASAGTCSSTCRHMPAYAGNSLIFLLTQEKIPILYAAICRHMPAYAILCVCMPAYAGRCVRMRVSAGICRHLLAHAGICLFATLSHPIGRGIPHTFSSDHAEISAITVGGTHHFERYKLHISHF